MEKDDTEVAGLSSEAEGDPAASREAPEQEADQEDEEQQQQQQQEELPARQRQTENEVSEVEIPNVGRIMVRADADGYNEEVRTCHNRIWNQIAALFKPAALNLIWTVGILWTKYWNLKM